MPTPGEPFDIGYAGWFGWDVRPLVPQLAVRRSHDRRCAGLRELLALQLAEVQPPARAGVAAHRGGALSRLRRAGCADLARCRAGDPGCGPQRGEFVSARVGCIVLNPFLDLTAVCLNDEARVAAGALWPRRALCSRPPAGTHAPGKAGRSGSPSRGSSPRSTPRSRTPGQQLLALAAGASWTIRRSLRRKDSAEPELADRSRSSPGTGGRTRSPSGGTRASRTAPGHGTSLSALRPAFPRPGHDAPRRTTATLTRRRRGRPRRQGDDARGARSPEAGR